MEGIHDCYVGECYFRVGLICVAGLSGEGLRASARV